SPPREQASAVLSAAVKLTGTLILRHLNYLYELPYASQQSVRNVIRDTVSMITRH
ncbi:Uncharacterized protein DAT39_019175, partial [Clarias magur]